jgi:cyclohexyl-isocyanide hydratase
MNRREFNNASASAAPVSLSLASQDAIGQENKDDNGATQSQPEPLQVGMLLYPGVTLLDLMAPQTVLSGFSDIHLVWKSTDPITSDTGIEIRPTTTLEDCPKDLDVLFVPGGPGMISVMRDADVLTFLSERGADSKYVTSVCSGSIILGAAGLLRGYKATSHWAAKAFLPMLGAEPADGRVVIDRNRITGGGVTSGIDFGLILLARLRGDAVAESTQLAIEYDPQPPFHTGSPRYAPTEVTQSVLKAFEPLDLQIRQIIAELHAAC